MMMMMTMICLATRGHGSTKALLAAALTSLAALLDRVRTCGGPSFDFFKFDFIARCDRNI